MLRHAPIAMPAARRLALGLLLGAVALAACGPAATHVPPTSAPTQTAAPTSTPALTVSLPLSVQDQIEIYAVVLRQLYGPDDTFGGTFQASVTYIYRQTDDGAGGVPTVHGLGAVLPAEVQAGITAALADLPTHIIWVDAFADVPRDSQSGLVIGHGAAFRLGGIIPQADGSTQVAGSIYVASLAAGGTTYVLAQHEGHWSVTGNTGTQWIS